MKRNSLLVFLLLLLAAAALQPGYVDNVDSRIILRTAERLVDDGTWSLGDVEGTYFASGEYGARGPHGDRYAKFGPGNALLDLPFLVAGRQVLGAFGLDRPRAGEAGVSMAPALWFALAGMALLRVLRRIVSPRAAVAGTLAWAFATFAVVYARSSYLEMPLTAAVLFAYDAALSSRSRGGAWSSSVLLGVACGAVLWIKLAGLVWLAGLPLLLLAGPGGGGATLVRTTVRAALTFIPAVAAFLALNAARFGGPLSTGYSDAAWFGHDLLSGLVHLLVSERAGLLFYAPFAFAGLAALPFVLRKDAGLHGAVAAASLASIVLHALWCSPEGGDVWGPRYLLTTSALLILPATAFAAGHWECAGLRFAAAALVAGGALMHVAPALTSVQEIYTLRGALGRLRVPNVPLSARILREKMRGEDTYDLARLGLGEGTWLPPRVQAGLALWPLRVAEQVPRAATAAWIAWGGLVVAAAGCGKVLRGSVRDEGRAA